MNDDLFSIATAAGWVEARADHPFRELIDLKHALILAAWARACETLAGVHPPFAELYAWFSRIPEAAQHEVLLHPASVRWISRAHRFSVGLTRRMSSPSGPSVSGSAEDLAAEFSDVLAAAVVVAGEDGDVVVRVDRAGRVSLPGTRSWLQCWAPAATVRLSIRAGRVLRADGVHAGSERLAAFQGPAHVELPWLQVNDGVLELNVCDRRFVEDWLPAVTGGGIDARPAEVGALGGWATRVGTSLRVLSELSAPLVPQLGCTLRCLIPVVPAVEGHQVSCSSDEFFGAAQVSATSGIELAQEIAHEFRHNVLNAIVSFEPVFQGDEGQRCVYSPWKHGPRPLIAVLHGIYSFQEVLAVYRAWLEREPDDVRARTQAALQAARLERAMAAVRAGVELTAFGAAFVDHLEQRITRLIEGLPRGAAALIPEARARVWAAP